MDIDNKNFKKKLYGILENIADATFVSFDLEMSGINKRAYGTQDHSDGKPDLQTLYEQTKHAAETYQVLQFGMTIVEEDRAGGFYTARPFNINISPLVAQDRNVRDRFPERNITFESNSTSFLVREGFDIGKIFTSGVPYLSYVEEGEAMHRYRIRTGEERLNGVQPPMSIELSDFVKRARATIVEWIGIPKPHHAFVNIDAPKGGMSSYHRKLVYDLVRHEFPGFRCAARDGGSFMQITKVNDTMQRQIAQDIWLQQTDAVANQIGLRWIFDALSGDSIDALPPSWLLADDDDCTAKRDQHAINEKFELLKKRLRNKKTAIVGHNLFTDLVYLIQTFTGNLPKHWADFQQTVNDKFPVIIDTKYMATAKHGRMSPEMQKDLKALFLPFRNNHVPLVIQDARHQGYVGRQGKNHEAGYDSWITAQLFLKMAGQFYAESKRAVQNSHNNVVLWSAGKAYYSTGGEYSGASYTLGTPSDQISSRYTGSPMPRGRIGNDHIDSRFNQNNYRFNSFGHNSFNGIDIGGIVNNGTGSGNILNSRVDNHFRRKSAGQNSFEKNDSVKNSFSHKSVGQNNFRKNILEKNNFNGTGSGHGGLDSSHIDSDPIYNPTDEDSFINFAENVFKGTYNGHMGKKFEGNNETASNAIGPSLVHNNHISSPLNDDGFSRFAESIFNDTDNDNAGTKNNVIGSSLIHYSGIDTLNDDDFSKFAGDIFNHTENDHNNNTGGDRDLIGSNHIHKNRFNSPLHDDYFSKFAENVFNNVDNERVGKNVIASGHVHKDPVNNLFNEDDFARFSENIFNETDKGRVSNSHNSSVGTGNNCATSQALVKKDPQYTGTTTAVGTPYFPASTFTNTGAETPAVPEQWLPPMEDRFWAPYTNMLRINACDVGFCNMGAHSPTRQRPAPAICPRGTRVLVPPPMEARALLQG